MCLYQSATGKMPKIQANGSSRHKADVHRIRMKPTGKWES